jgi:hypothetical protein
VSTCAQNVTMRVSSCTQVRTRATYLAEAAAGGCWWLVAVVPVAAGRSNLQRGGDKKYPESQCTTALPLVSRLVHLSKTMRQKTGCIYHRIIFLRYIGRRATEKVLYVWISALHQRTHVHDSAIIKKQPQLTWVTPASSVAGALFLVVLGWRIWVICGDR